MITLSIISLLLSFLFQGLFSNFHNYTLNSLSIFSCIFLLINFVVLQPYFESDKKFLTIIIIFGLIFDIVYTNTLVLNTFIFILIFYLNKLFNFLFPNNIFTINIFSLISMIIYHILTYIFLWGMKFDNFNIIILLKVILCNLIVTFIYATIIYKIIEYFYNKLNLKIIRD